MKSNLLVFVGPTAVGKTDMALEVAKRLDAEIVSADSMQIYKYMDIGTAKPSKSEQAEVSHHMIDIVNPDDEFSVADYQTLAIKAIDDILRRGKLPILTGGTGLYINAVCYNYTFSEHHKDEELRKRLREDAQKYGNEFIHKRLMSLDPVGAKKIHPNNVRRVIRAIEVSLKTEKPFSYFEENTKRQNPKYQLSIIGLTRPRAQLYLRINQRVGHMMDAGFVDEVKGLLDRGYSKKLNSMQGLGYRQIVNFLEGIITENEAVELIARNTRRYAKRQYTWFLRDKNIIWEDISGGNQDEIIDRVCHCFEGKQQYS